MRGAEWQIVPSQPSSAEENAGSSGAMVETDIR
jgi:hypothetical protein